MPQKIRETLSVRRRVWNNNIYFGSIERHRVSRWRMGVSMIFVLSSKRISWSLLSLVMMGSNVYELRGGMSAICEEESRTTGNIQDLAV